MEDTTGIRINIFHATNSYAEGFFCRQTPETSKREYYLQSRATQRQEKRKSGSAGAVESYSFVL
jgi:hypothetical protein